jgi:phenylacetate-coenzyme A ligase PaaK-like adenylate-forming protein
MHVGHARKWRSDLVTGRELIKAVAKLHGYAIFRRFLDRSQWWTTDERDAWIEAHLRSTLIAALEVPFYRDAFAAAGFDPRVDFKSPRDLTMLPILTKQQVRREHDRLIDPSRRVPSIIGYTSGTTGQRLAMRLDEAFLAFDAACTFRHWSWSGFRLGQSMAALRNYVPEREGDPLWRYSRTQNTMYFSAYHLTPQNCEQYIDRVLALRPTIIRGYPSSMKLFAEYAHRRRHQLSFVNAIITSSETLLPRDRETIEGTFGNKVFNWYGMTEPAMVLTECERHEGLHVNWEYGYAELLPSDDLPPDEFRLVTTSFHNPTMPFIRYETGDIVRRYSDGRRCGCGRTMPLVHSISGRSDECIVTPDGRLIPCLSFYSVFRKYNEISRFQVAQYGDREIVVRIAPRPGVTCGADMVQRIRDEVRAGVCPSIALEVRVSSKFATNADGKTPPVIRLSADSRR